jgi:hypothetical protein
MPNTCQMPVANWRRRCSTGSQGRLARRAIARLAVATTLIWQARCRAPTERQTPASPSLRPASVLLRRATPTTTAHRSRTLPAPRARTPPARPSHGASWAPSAAPCATDRYPATAAGAGNAPSGFAHYSMPICSNTGGRSYSCYSSCYGEYSVNEHMVSNETYPVRPDTVLSDEPGHLG